MDKQPTCRQCGTTCERRHVSFRDEKETVKEWCYGAAARTEFVVADAGLFCSTNCLISHLAKGDS